MVTSPAVFSATTADYQTIEWTELMPPEDLEALMNPPEYLSEIADGSLEDQINSQLQGAMTADDSRYQQALSSTQIVPEFDNRKVRIPAFIVPLEYDDDQRVTEFFLVPYFGACIHVPPPPPNQIIHASYDQGMTLEALYDAFWISGTLQTTMTENDTATSAYSIAVEAIEPYTE
ncbi:hypothetical protein imdm_1703 [gamma proteobacterium IMCC2047]|nr:hypothetical protein imdm_1703 [gamma proteobacterium IMCC2047]